MLKSIQIKIVLVFLVIGLVVIAGIGGSFIYELNYAKTQIQEVTTDPQLILNIIDNELYNSKVIIGIVAAVFTVISIIVGVYLTKSVIGPLYKLIKNAEKIASGEDTELKYLTDGKNKNEIDELVGAFGMMTTELKENLNEVSRQKNQIETILLHMSDGIIAFNMKGKIILVNPAATRLLRIMPEDENFEQIFKRINVEINMEKIIYLENWTSSEQRVTIGDKYINLFFEPFKDEKDRPSGVMVMIQDIT